MYIETSKINLSCIEKYFVKIFHVTETESFLRHAWSKAQSKMISIKSFTIYQHLGLIQLQITSAKSIYCKLIIKARPKALSKQIRVFMINNGL